MERLGAIAQAATAITAVVAVVTMIVTILNIKKGTDTERIRRWQEVVVYSIISKASGVDFKVIRTDYLQEVQIEGFNIPREEIQNPALRRIILYLLAQGLIIIGPDGLYRVKASVSPPDDPLAQPKVHAAGRAILTLISRNHCKYNTERINTMIDRDHKLTSDEFSALIVDLIASGRIVRHSNDTLCSVTKAIPLQTPSSH